MMTKDFLIKKSILIPLKQSNLSNTFKPSFEEFKPHTLRVLIPLSSSDWLNYITKIGFFSSYNPKFVPKADFYVKTILTGYKIV
jgi:hypothetical protein